MQVNLDSLNCGICYSTIEDAVSCDSCGNSFCSQCVNDYIKISRKNNQILKCPMCNKKYFRPLKNNSVNELMVSFMENLFPLQKLRFTAR